MNGTCYTKNNNIISCTDKNNTSGYRCTSSNNCPNQLDVSIYTMYYNMTNKSYNGNKLKTRYCAPLPAGYN